jgi:transposase InsO family protein
MHKPHDGGEEDVHLLRQEQGFPGYDYFWRWEPRQGQRFGKDIHHKQALYFKCILVESLGYDLLSVSQLCHMGYNCLFTNVDVSVFRSDGSLAFKGVLDNKLYLVDFLKEETDLDACLIAKTSMGWLWHHRLAHVGMKNLHKLLKGEHVLGLTNVCFEKDRPCAACQAGKQVGSTHHNKNVMTTSRPLELLHMDLFEPVAYLSIGGSKYGLVIVDEFSRFTWVFFL